MHAAILWAPCIGIAIHVVARSLLRHCNGHWLSGCWLHNRWRNPNAMPPVRQSLPSLVIMAQTQSNLEQFVVASFMLRATSIHRWTLSFLRQQVWSLSCRTEDESIYSLKFPNPVTRQGREQMATLSTSGHKIIWAPLFSWPLASMQRPNGERDDWFPWTVARCGTWSIYRQSLR